MLMLMIVAAPLVPAVIMVVVLVLLTG